MAEPQTVYHISLKYLGKRPVLTPRCPETRAEGESDTPRVCVARDVFGAYMSKRAEFDWCAAPAFHVYRTITGSRKADVSVDDRDWTGERWITEPVKFEYVGKMPRIVFHGIRSWHSNAYRNRIMREWIEGTFDSLLWQKRAHEAPQVFTPDER